MPTYRVDVDRYQGWLCIAVLDTAFDEPLTVDNYYPICKYAKDQHEEFVGLEAHKRSAGVYAVKVGGDGGYWRDFTLRDGGDTMPSYTNIQELPCPKSRGLDTRYKNGRWEKQTAKGWAAA